ncbi:hypothetical protein NZK33_20715 [Cyanobium sp. FGCU-6]|nr:hypothetical protein [Cyanobium sp. FGCU6]
MSIQELTRTIEFAKLRCLDFNCLAEKLLASSDYIDTSIVNRLKEMSLSGTENKRLIEACDVLSERARTGPASFREKVDRTINRILRILPNEFSYPFAIEYLNDSLKRRRAWAYTAMRGKELSPNQLPYLIEVFDRRKDQDALQLIVRNPPLVDEIDPGFLLSNLNDKYWKARTIEALLQNDRDAGLRVAEEYPIEFAHAVGRLRDKSLLKPLSALLEPNAMNISFLSIYSFALGRLGALDELERVSQYAKAMFSATS